MLRIVLCILSILFVKKPSFTTCSSVCYSVYGESDLEIESGYINETLFVIQREKTLKFHSNAILHILLLLSGDIETCPGPRELPELSKLLDQRGMHLVHQNVRGLFSNKDYVSEIIESFEGIHVFALTETHLNNDYDYGHLFDIQGFGFESKPRSNGSGGGV